MLFFSFCGDVRMASYCSKKFFENKCKQHKFERVYEMDYEPEPVDDYCDDIVTQEPRSLSGMDDLEQDLLSCIINTLARMFSMDDFMLLGYGDERFCQVILDGYSQVMIRFPIQGVSISIFSTDMGVIRTMLSNGMDTLELDMGIYFDTHNVTNEDQWIGAIESIVIDLYPMIAQDYLSYVKSGEFGCMDDDTGEDDNGVTFTVKDKEPHVPCRVCRNHCDKCDDEGAFVVGRVSERYHRRLHR